MRSFSELVASISRSTAIQMRDCFCANFCSEIPLQPWNFVWSGNFADASPSGDTRNFHATWVQVPVPTAWLVTDIRLLCRLDLFTSLLLNSKVKILIAMVLRSHNPQFLVFSESSTSAIPDGVAKFLESLSNSSGSSRACWQSKTFPKNAHILSCISRHSNFAARLSWTRSNKSLMRNVGTS